MYTCVDQFCNDTHRMTISKETNVKKFRQEFGREPEFKDFLGAHEKLSAGEKPAVALTCSQDTVQKKTES